MKGKTRRKFGQTWSNQTALGKKFGLTAIQVGQCLIEEGLKDAESGHATEKALVQGYARSTPLKSGRSHFMWHIAKATAIIAKTHPPLTRLEYWSNEVQAALNGSKRLAGEAACPLSRAS